MSAPVFAVMLFTAALALALWLDVRLGGKGPASLSQIVLHAIVAILLLRAASHVVGATDGQALMIVLFAILLPALIYVFLTSLWMLKMLRGAMPR
jgi:hypothetical protein